MIPLGTNNSMSLLPLHDPPLWALAKFVAVSLLAYETSARIHLQPFFLPPNLQNIQIQAHTHPKQRFNGSNLKQRFRKNLQKTFSPIT
jgi:hypothetical protein